MIPLRCLFGFHDWACVLHRGIGCRVECTRCARADVTPDCPKEGR